MNNTHIYLKCGEVLWIDFPENCVDQYIWIQNCSGENLVMGYHMDSLEPGKGGFEIRPSTVLGMEIGSKDKGLYFKGCGYARIAFTADDRCPFDGQEGDII